MWESVPVHYSELANTEYKVEKMSKQMALRPLDVPVALRLAECPEATFEALHDALGISVSTAHDAVVRLSAAGLVYPHARKVNRHALMEFLEHGVRYAFPAMLGAGRSRGIPTAHASPALAKEIVATDPIVWQSSLGTVTGDAMEPLYPQAVELPQRCPSVYESLTLVDALRVGRARERKIAVEKLRGWLRQTRAAQDA
jgi:hypothetical protein